MKTKKSIGKRSKLRHSFFQWLKISSLAPEVLNRQCFFPNSTKQESLKPIYKAVLWVSMWLLISFLSSCSVPAMFDGDSYGKKFKNKFLWFEVADLSKIYVSDRGEFKTAIIRNNGDEFLIEWEKCNRDYTLKVTYYSGAFHFFHFFGFGPAEYWEEMPWIKEGKTFILESNRLIPPEDGMYRIALTEDLTK